MKDNKILDEDRTTQLADKILETLNDCLLKCKSIEEKVDRLVLKTRQENKKGQK